MARYIDVRQVATGIVLLIVGALGSLFFTEGGWDWVKERFDDDPSAEERRVDDLYKFVDDNTFWRDKPDLAERSRPLFIDHWEEASPYFFHESPPEIAENASVIDLRRLERDRRLDGRPVRIRGTVNNLGTFPVEGFANYIRQVFDVEGDESRIEAYCYTTLSTSRELREGDTIEAVAIPIARGSIELTGGGYQLTTFASCPFVKRT